MKKISLDLLRVIARVMAVLEPVKVVISNVADVSGSQLDVPDMSHVPQKGSHKVTFNPNNLYMERGDIREVRMCVCVCVCMCGVVVVSLAQGLRS